MSTAAAAIWIASDIRPTPASLDSAISLVLGPTIWTPSRRSCSTLRRVAVLFHIRGFIAGASRIGRLAASRIALARSSAWSCAIFAIRSAVAGATTIRSHSRASWMMHRYRVRRRGQQIGIDALMRQRAGGKRRDELLRGLGQHAADVNVPLLQPSDQFQRFEGGDAAADDQGDVPFAVRADGPRGLPGASVGGGEAPPGSRGAPVISSPRMTRTSSSTERPFPAERRRR